MPLSSLSVLSTLFVFPLHFPPLGSSPLPPSLALTRRILPTLFHSLLTSRALLVSFFSPLGLPLAPLFHIPKVVPGSVWQGWGLAGSTSYPICVSITRSCPLNPPLIHQPASQPAQAASSRHTYTPHHWLMAVRTPAHSTHQPAFIPWPQWMQNVQYSTTELYSNGFYYNRRS